MFMTQRTMARGRQAGLSVVELIVGMALGLVVVSGAITLFVGNVGTSRRMLVEARMNQDLRAAADVVARELRRAGYWENSIAGTATTSTGSAATANPNAAISANAASSTITYSIARDSMASPARTYDNTMQTDEQFGFKLDSGVLKMQIGTTWQPLTDPNVVTVNNFSITPTETALDIREACAKTCTGTSCPTLTVRSYALMLQGTAASDSGVTRVLQETVRVRNDATTGTCPA